MGDEETPRPGRLTARAVIDRFNEAFNWHDADALAPLLTEDTVFEDTSPAPDGQRIGGKTNVVAFWRGWFARNPDARFEAEDVIVSGQPWRLRGVDMFTVRDGKVTARLAYVKGQLLRRHRVLPDVGVDPPFVPASRPDIVEGLGVLHAVPPA